MPIVIYSNGMRQQDQHVIALVKIDVDRNGIYRNVFFSRELSPIDEHQLWAPEKLSGQVEGHRQKLVFIPFNALHVLVVGTV